MDNKGLYGIIIIFMTLLVGVVLLQSVSDSVADTSTVKSANGTLSVAGNAALLATATARAANNIITSGTIMYNITNATIGTNNYQVFTNGSVILNAGMTGAAAQGTNPTTLKLYHTFFSENYINDSTSRVIIGLITLLFAIGVVVVVIGKVKDDFDNFGFGG